MALRFIIDPFAKVHVTVRVNESSITFGHIVAEPALINRSVLPNFLSFTVRNFGINYDLTSVLSIGIIMVFHLLIHHLRLSEIRCFSIFKWEVRELLDLRLDKLTFIVLVVKLVIR